MAERNEIEAGLPVTVRAAGVLVTLEGVAGVVAAIVNVVRAALGEDQSIVSGLGNGVWFGVIGGAVLAAGVSLLLGKRWGRAIAAIANLLLLPVAWSLLTDSHQPLYGVLLGVVVIVTLATLFAPPSNRWMAQDYGELPAD